MFANCFLSSGHAEQFYRVMGMRPETGQQWKESSVEEEERR